MITPAWVLLLPSISGTERVGDVPPPGADLSLHLASTDPSLSLARGWPLNARAPQVGCRAPRPEFLSAAGRAGHTGGFSPAGRWSPQIAARDPSEKRAPPTGTHPSELSPERCANQRWVVGHEKPTGNPPIKNDRADRRRDEGERDRHLFDSQRAYDRPRLGVPDQASV